MHLDLPTLAVVTVFIISLLGMLLTAVGWQNRTAPALLWWGSAFLIGAAGFGALTGRSWLPRIVSYDIANALLLLCFGVLWSGVRVFEGRAVKTVWLVALPAFWLLACRVPAFSENTDLRVIVLSLITTVLMLLSAREIWLGGRREVLTSRGLVVSVFLVYATSMLLRVPMAIVAPFGPDGDVTASPIFSYVQFAALLFIVTVAFLLLNMTKERSELGHKTASLIDPLTGIANRRAFLATASQDWQKASVADQSLALLLFDLDRFKNINDRFGHAQGDRVLYLFAQETRRVFGMDVLFGRLGGEEFAALITGRSAEEVLAVAQNVRVNFERKASSFGDALLRPTVSIGVAIGDPSDKLEAMLEVADTALYRAKAAGRNRVEFLPTRERPVVGLGEGPPVAAAEAMIGDPLALLPSGELKSVG